MINLKFKKKLIEISLIIFLTLFFNKVSAIEVKIVTKINNEIITNIDVEKEARYLLALNNDLKVLKDYEIISLAKESLIREKIKKKELLKFYTFDQKHKYLDEILENFYKKLNINNIENFKIYLSNYNLTILEIKKKLEIETVWNEYIFKEYINKIDINTEVIIKKLNKEIKNNKKKSSYELSEIVFVSKDMNERKDKLKIIYEKIRELGFKNTANIYSVSDTSKFGGKIGWVDENKLSSLINNELKKIQIGQLTSPIEVTGGTIILKLENKKLIKTKIDFDDELNKLIIAKKNYALDQFSSLHFNRIKKRTKIISLN